MRKSLVPTADLNRILGNKMSFIALLQEPSFNSGKIQGLNRRKGNVIHAIGKGKPRACIYISKDWIIQPLYHLCTRDLSVARLKAKKFGNDIEMLICSAYFPYDSMENPPTEEFLNLIRYCKSNAIPLISSIDANAHHHAWGSKDINDRGKSLLEFILSSDLMINNIGCKPTFVIKNRSEVLDLTLSSPELFSAITDWKVTDQILTSDHRCIRFNLDLDTQPPLLFRNPAATNWNTFTNNVVRKLNPESNLPDLLNVYDLEQEVETVHAAIFDSYEIACPLHKHKAGNSLPYYTSEDKALRAKLRRTFNLAKSPTSNVTWDDFYNVQRSYKMALKKKERVGWKMQCSAIDNLRDSSKMFKILSKDPVQLVGSLQLPSGEYTETLDETYKHLVSTHFPGSKIVEGEESLPFVALGAAATNASLIQEIITDHRISWAVNTFAPFKSPGEDGIFPALIQKSIHIIVNRLRRIFIASLSLKYVPNRWRGTRVAFTPKPGNTDYSKANNFRPISLTSFFLKTLEKLIDRYIRDRPLSIKRLQPKQHAYQLGKSCENALHNLLTTIEAALLSNEYALGCFIDIAGAFNYITYLAIMNACRKFGIDPGIADWIFFMLKSRIVFVRFGETKLTIIVTKGSPQGGVLPPLLWCMVIDGLIESLNSLGHQTEGFSDDLATILRGKYVPTLCDILQGVLNKVSKWCSDNELEINPAKTKMILFRKNRKKLEGIRIPTINGIPILLVDEVKYLGIILDYSLSWIPNIDNRIHKATIALWQCRKAYGKSWGLSPKVLYWIYTSVVRPILLYGSFLWNHKCCLKTVMDKLNKFQRLACKAITGAWHSAPTAALEAILNLTPLHILVETEALSVLNRLKRNSDIQIKDAGHSKIYYKSKGFLPIMHLKTDYICPTFKFERSFELNIAERSLWENNILPLVNSKQFYTDGSLINEQAGAGAFCECPKVELAIPLGTHCSIYLAEIAGLIKCCQKIKELKTVDEVISIYTDSQAAIKALKNPKISSALTLKCWQALEETSVNNKVNVTWVPGHSGIIGNERADELAKQGALTSTELIPEPLIGIPPSIVKHELIKYRYLRSTKYWNQQEGCKQSKNNVSLRKNHSKFLLNLSRTRLKVYVGVMTGHFDFNKHLTNIGKRSDPGCDLCGAHIDSADHYLCQCPALIQFRFRCLGNYVLRIGTIKALHPKDILSYICSSGRFREKYGV